VHLLDNDFFGQPKEQWQQRIAEIKGGKFKVCFNQGINIRMVDDETAAALAAIDCRDDQFKTKRLYTAWDNLGDEKRFFRGVDCLAAHGVNPSHLMAYMLVGYDRRETWETVLYRFHQMAKRGIRPYPMVYGERKRGLPVGGYASRVGHLTLADFQRWAIRKAYTIVPFEDYDRRIKGHLRV
jgi:hypothetical protein